MQYLHAFLYLIASGLLLTQVDGHGGKSLGEELHAREVYARHNKMDLSHCAEKFQRDGLIAHAVERRLARLNTLHKKTTNTIGQKNMAHRVDKGFDLDSDQLKVLSTRKHGCVLHPELTEGPYYVRGEHVREKLVSRQHGEDLFLDLQIIDSDSCKPVKDTNATGVYSGVVADGNGSGDHDPGNAYTTFNRGAQKTDKHGIVSFHSIFPGHYEGRAPHIHVMTHIKPKVLQDGTIMSNTATHIGQLFFDQGLINNIKAQPRYRNNSQSFTPNSDDYYLEMALKTSDPILSWTRLKEHDDAVLGWIPIGMWLLENEETFEGRRLWLRPDKTYLFGRTAAERERPNSTIQTIIWNPVVFSFVFTSKEMQTNPLNQLQERFEQLDVKLVTDFTSATTHVVSKKRNTAKGLQALINGKYIVNETFLNAVVEAVSVPEGADAAELSALEKDFDAHWPAALQHLPPRGGEPVQHPDSTYTPDLERNEIFNGYTFIFYDKTQYNNLLAPITSGCGKALLGDVVPNQTEVDEFVQYVKHVAGEKGLGAFDDGSEGKGVVLVRYLPSKGSGVNWYTEFITAVSLRLDHRPIEQSEFLEAILIKDASILRRPLEVESTQNTQAHQETTPIVQPDPAPQPTSNRVEAETPAPEPVEESQPAPRRGRTRRPVKRRFAGFDDDADIDMDDTPSAPAPESHPPVEEEAGLFVSQDPDAPPPQVDLHNTRQSRRKRQASALPEDDLMEGMAPAAAMFKRQRLERGEDLNAPSPEADKPTETAQPEPKKKIKKEFDILAMAAQNREEEEARARAEKEDLANLPDDVDLSEIRRLNIVEEFEVRAPASQTRSREQDVLNGRWNPKWNGMQNFKKFRKRGETTGRPPARVIVALTEVKNKEFGVGDDYWLEDEEVHGKKKQTSQASGLESQTSAVPPPPPPPSRPAQRRAVGVVLSDSSEDDNDNDKDNNKIQEPEPAPRTRTRASASQSQSNTRSQSSRATSQGSKRTAPEPAREQPPKRQRPTRKPIMIADSDDSDDELKFRFGKRR
ncbi:hypothetical protein G7Z17_g7026 [Cylindrodendrum hubeiense]|uniref:Nibrin second BRCT domain-containing protein n=1 Tax=Cylindrodendrum hubeiense TaxID=595255 RepID=A0A9P5L7Q3_9HYPO|nr:hypothetical protein G7Z17_g7026 [Cylindrodendrum hubeiense]